MIRTLPASDEPPISEPLNATITHANIPPYTYNESAVVSVVNLVLSEGIDNGRIIAERINKARYQTKGGKTWDKDIYPAWKRHKDIIEKLM